MRNPETVTTRVDTQLLDGDTGAVLDTLSLPQGFPARTPLVQRDNYPGRAPSIRVVLNPRFKEGASSGPSRAASPSLAARSASTRSHS